jgi:hypothetical protein
VTATDPVQDIIGVGVLAIAFLTYIQGKRVKQTAQKTETIESKVDQVHSLVNNQLDIVMNKNLQLVEDLKVAKTQPAEGT